MSRGTLPPLWAALLLLACPAAAQDRTPIKVVMEKALAPDGSRVAFAWRDDVWIADSRGGVARRLTIHPARDGTPRFSPDGKRIAFLSTRDGGAPQVYVMPVAGGRPRRITPHTEGYDLLEWTPDGADFLVSARRDHFWRHAERFFIQPRDGKSAPEVLFDGYGHDGTLSPDGRKLLFAREGTGRFRKGYYGSQESQIWEYDRSRDSFRLLHGQGEGGCRWPLWAPDGTYYYVSQDQGAWNLYHVDGESRRPLTRYEGDGVLHPAIARDGSTIVFTRLFDLFRLDTKTGEVELVELWDAGDPTMVAERRETFSRATDVALTDDAREIALVAGGDVWVMDTELREPVRVTDTPEEERDVLFSRDFKRLFFVSDSGGQCDVWCATRSDEDRYWWQNDSFELRKLTDDQHVERDLVLYDEGRRIAFKRGRGDVLSMDPDGSDVQLLLASWNDPAVDFSPDGKWMVYSVSDDDYNRDVWIKPLDGSREPFNLSCHPDNDFDPVWSPDGRRIAFVGRRWGDETDLVYVNLRKEDEEQTSRQRRLEKALEKMKGRKKKKGKKGGKAEPAAATKKEPAKPADPISGRWEGTVLDLPDVPDGAPFQMDLSLGKDGGITGTWTSAMDAGDVTGTYDADDGTVTFTSEVEAGILTVKGKVAGDRMEGTWDVDGLMGGRWSARRVTPAAATAAEDGKGAEKDAEEKDEDGRVEVVIDFEGLRDRLHRIRVPDSRERSLSWSPDGKRLYFTASYRGKSGMHYVEIPEKLTPKFLTATRLSDARWIEDGNRLVGRRGGTPAVMSSSGKVKTHAFKAHAEIDAAAHHRAVFDAAWRTMRDRWYDENLGNNDWDAIREKYREAAETLDTTTLNRVCNMMLGELNGSHLGFSMRGSRSRDADPHEWDEVTGHLGTRFDDAWSGPGLKVRDVVRESPAWREDSRIEPGEVITQIDGVPVDPSLDIALFMTGEPERQVEVTVRSTTGEERAVRMFPTTYRRIRSLLYDEWLEQNRELVDRLSGGTLGYLHIRAMSRSSLQKFDEELYRIGHGKDGLVIDVRENGGGSITDHLLTCLTQPTHAVTRARGGGEGYPHDRRVYATWDKPIVVLCNQNSFSNAEIFSHAIKTLERGTIVGVPTAGGVISTGSASLMGVARIRVPFRGWYTLDGQDMELNGCVPHHIVWPEPCEWPAGKDRQLEKAIEVLMDDVEEWKDRPRPDLIKATERGS